MKPSPTRLATLVLPLLLAGCSLTPDYQRPEVPTPESWQTRTAAAAPTVDAQWWQRFASPELDRLMEAAMTANQDVAAALARLEQARAAARIARAGELPTVDAGATVSRSGGSDRRSRSDGEAGLSVAYEADLWGARDADIEAARARFAASAFDLDAVRLVLQSELAAQYFQALALRDRLAIANENLRASRRLLELVQLRFDNGAASALELAQQRTSVFNQEAGIPNLEQQLQQTVNAIAVLLGRPPQGMTLAGASLAELALPEVDPGQPAALLERRPDVRRVEAQLVAANADIGAARAALYPSLRLSASGTVTGLLDGGSSTVGSLAASLAQSIFDGGRRRAQIEQSEARRTELAASYVRTVLEGFREVEDSLVAVRANEARAASLAQAAEQADEALRLATIRYEEGAEDLLTLLDSQRSRLSSQDALVQARLGRYTATTQLFKALGGGWATL